LIPGWVFARLATDKNKTGEGSMESPSRHLGTAAGEGEIIFLDAVHIPLH
jgi:hypothetical protein